MNNKINIALDDPIRYFKNFLRNRVENNPTNVPVLENFVYCCIWAFIYTCSKDHHDSEYYYNKYQDEIEDEISFLKEEKSKSDTIIALTKYPMIRDLVYSSEKESLLLHCNSIEDYERYLEEHKDSCYEFELYAKYKISILSSNYGNRFDHIPEVINLYPYSDIFDLELLKSQCTNINGLLVQFNNGISCKQRSLITDLINNSTQIKTETNDSVLVGNHNLTKLDLVLLKDYDFDMLKGIISSPENPTLIGKTAVCILLKILCSFTGLNWDLPAKELKGDIAENLSEDIWWKEDICSLTTIEEYHHFLPIIYI